MSELSQRFKTRTGETPKPYQGLVLRAAETSAAASKQKMQTETAGHPCYNFTEQIYVEHIQT
jgi:hypothetical protein